MRPCSVFLRRHDCRAVWLLRRGNDDLLRGVLRILLAVMLIGDLAQIGPERLALLLGTVGTKHIKHTKHSFFSCISAALPGYTLGIVFARGVWVMRSKRGIFWYSLGLTLLLLLPMILTVAFFADQYQKQQLLRRASAADSTLRIEPGAQGIFPLLLVIQQEEPAFLLVRADGPQQTLTFCALPGSLRVDAPSGTTTLADCTLAAGAGRAAQLLCGTVATGESAAPALHYIAATPATWAACAGSDALVRFDTAALLTPAARQALGYGREPVAECTAAQAGALIEKIQGMLTGASAQADARAAVWAAFARQNPALPAAFPAGLRSQSARLLTDLLAADVSALEDTLTYLSTRPAPAVDYVTAETAKAKGGVCLTDAGMAAVRDLLS